MTGIRNVLINGDKPCCIVLNGTLIEGVYEQPDRAPSVDHWVDGQGCEAYPAGIDMHVHDRWGEPEREDPEHLEDACMAGGTATIVVMPNTKPPYSLAEQTKTRVAGFGSLNVLAWIAATRTNAPERRAARRLFPQQVPGAKLMMASTNNPETLVDDEPSQRRILEENAEIGCITTVHAEAEDYIKRNRQAYEQMFGQLTRHHHCKIRESAVEVEGIRRILNIHREVGGRIHIAHVSTAMGINLILDAKNHGQNVTFETCPHYWTFNDSWVEQEDGGDYKMNPALRPPKEQMAVLDHFINGDVDVSATDHAPHPRKLKALPGLDECPSGVPGVETHVPLVYRLKNSEIISTKQFISLTSGRAAQILGLNKGALKPGFDADIILIDPHKATVISDRNVKSKCGWTPYRGEAVHPITMVVIGGKICKQNFTHPTT